MMEVMRIAYAIMQHSIIITLKYFPVTEKMEWGREELALFDFPVLQISEQKKSNT